MARRGRFGSDQQARRVQAGTARPTKTLGLRAAAAATAGLPTASRRQEAEEAAFLSPVRPGLAEWCLQVATKCQGADSTRGVERYKKRGASKQAVSGAGSRQAAMLGGWRAAAQRRCRAQLLAAPQLRQPRCEVGLWRRHLGRGRLRLAGLRQRQPRLQAVLVRHLRRCGVGAGRGRGGGVSDWGEADKLSVCPSSAAPVPAPDTLTPSHPSAHTPHNQTHVHTTTHVPECPIHRHAPSTSLSRFCCTARTCCTSMFTSSSGVLSTAWFCIACSTNSACGREGRGGAVPGGGRVGWCWRRRMAGRHLAEPPAACQEQVEIGWHSSRSHHPTTQPHHTCTSRFSNCFSNCRGGTGREGWGWSQGARGGGAALIGMQQGPAGR